MEAADNAVFVPTTAITMTATTIAAATVKLATRSGTDIDSLTSCMMNSISLR